MRWLHRLLWVVAVAGPLACDTESVRHPDVSPSGAARGADERGQPAGRPPPMASSQPAPSMEPTGSLVSEPGAPFTGTVRLEASGAGASVRPEDVLFIMARSQGGQLIAVKRIAPVQLPYEFEISSKDVMVPGLPFGGPFQVSARLDRDGDPLTRGEDDLHAAATGLVRVGQTRVELPLRAGPPGTPPSTAASQPVR